MSINSASSSRSVSISACSSRIITKNILSIFLAIVLSNNYESSHGHKHPNARWPRKFALKAGFTSLQKLGEVSRFTGD
jgi:hypothetical protein